MTDDSSYDEVDALRTFDALARLGKEYPSPEGGAFLEHFTGFDMALRDLADESLAAPFRAAAASVERRALATVALSKDDTR